METVMPRPRLACLLSLIALLPALAQAAEHAHTLSGKGLDMSGACARSVQIMPDPALAGQVAVQAAAVHPEEIAQLAFESGDTARIRRRTESCWRPQEARAFQPTLILTIRVPARAPLTISDGGNLQYRIGPVGGPLTLALSGSGTVRAEAVDRLSAQLSGSQHLQVDQVQGEARLVMSGSDETDIDRADLRHLDAVLSGSGSLSVGSGHIASGSIRGSGSTNAEIGASTGDLSVTLAGSGTVRLARQEGTLTRSVAGSARILVGP